MRRPKDNAPNSVNSVPRKCVDSVKGHVTKPTGQSEGSRLSEKSCQEQEKAAARVTANLQSVDTAKDSSCASEADESWSTVEGTPEGEITSPEHDTGQLAVQYCDGSSDVDLENGSEFDTSNDFSEENSDYEQKSAQTEKGSPENHGFLDIKKNCTFIVDDFEKTDKVHDTEMTLSKGSVRASEGDFIGKVVEDVDFMQEQGHSDQHTTTDESSEELDRDSHEFTLHHSHVKDNTNCTENDTRNEMMSTNLQYVQMEISPVEESIPKLDEDQGAFLPGNFAVCGEGRNVHRARRSYIIENCREVERGELDNTENTIADRGNEEDIMKNASPNVTTTEQKTSEVGNDGNVNYSRREVILSQINVCSIEATADALKQRSYNTEDPYCDNSGKLAVCATEKVEVDIHTEKKQCVSKTENGVHHQEIINIDKEAYSMERCHLTTHIDGKGDVTTDVTNAVLEVPEFWKIL
ncbi:hypothetical protein ACROYT_G032876 [Oculina patagonica]